MAFAMNPLRIVVFTGVAWSIALSLPAQSQDDRVPIGEVLGAPIYRDQIRSSNEPDDSGLRLHGELHRLFTAPVMQQYRDAHQADLTPSKQELATAAAYFDREHQKRMRDRAPELRKQLADLDKQLLKADLQGQERQLIENKRLSLQMRLDPPGEMMAPFMLNRGRLQRHLYETYGGGRVLFQQGGLEAFDAMHRWLEAQERQGKFTITDPELHEAFYAYWTTHNHGAFLTDDEERVRFLLDPPWIGGPEPE